MCSSQLQNKIASWNEACELLKAIKTESFPIKIIGMNTGFKGFFLKEILKKIESNILLVLPTEKEIDAMLSDVSIAGASACILPSWQALPYTPLSSTSSIFAERSSALSHLASIAESGEIDKKTIFITTLRSLLTPVPPLSYLKSLRRKIKVNENHDIEELARLLVEWGYTRVPRVTVRGEFSLRGEVLDIAPIESKADENIAYRLQFDFETIEKIRLFNITSQASLEELKEVVLYSSKEVVWSDERIATLKENLIRITKEEESGIENLIEKLTTKKDAEGAELFFPLSFPLSAKEEMNILSYLNYHKTFTVFYVEAERVEGAASSLSREYLALYKRCKAEAESVNAEDKNFLQPEPAYILLDYESTVASYERSIFLKSLKDESDDASFILNIEGERNFFGNIPYFKEELSSLAKEGTHIYIFADTHTQSLRIGEILKDFPVTILPTSISSGFAIPSLKLLVIAEKEIFGRRRRVPKNTKHAKSEVIDSFVELNPGDYVVHVNYGIGLFKGIERVKIMDTERDYIKLQYANDESTFIPIEQADLVQRYIGNEGSAPALDVLGSKSWENRKNKVKKCVEDIAEKLIDLYSKRQIGKGFAFPKDDEWQASFEAAFPYEETADQLSCTEDVKHDMEKAEPMDRLVCGDVGFGKTEVAMRAAFKAVMGGKQVVFLAPTTILVEQHFETLQKRFAKFPVRIAKISRFVARKEQKQLLANLQEGNVDLVVGTHRIIQKDVIFKDLGLIIIDEEQRFGVKDKERLKALKTNVDCLALSATPIPRTLHMSLLKIRDMSCITTPPQNRKPVETIVEEFSEDLVARIIRRETGRSGQVFYLHNKIESLDETQHKLQQLLPELMIETAHGKMGADEIEDVFRRFALGGFQVLISTTIIENGIDIPNANTIIIDRADMYGVSQLYQLRGRVGRSDRKAFAALLYPGNKSLSEVAMKRLQAISDFTELGAGFKIAMKDMEIRGAGNLLGKEQSGYIYSVGFDLYLRLLSEAIEKLKNNDYVEPIDTTIELEYSGFIPDTYIKLAETKMEIYKKIAGVRSKDDLEAVVYEINDRFGPPPEEVESLLSLCEIKVICQKLFIKSLREKKQSVRIEFNRVSEISIEKLMRLIKTSHGRIKLDAKAPNMLLLEVGNIGLKEKSEFIYENLSKLL